jgi:hypothetical protein
MKFYKHLRQVEVSIGCVDQVLQKSEPHIPSAELQSITRSLKHLRSLYGNALTIAQLFTEVDAALQLKTSIDTAGFFSSVLINTIQPEIVSAIEQHQDYGVIRDQTILRGYRSAGDAGIIQDRCRIACFTLLLMPDGKNSELEVHEARLRLQQMVSRHSIRFDQLQVHIEHDDDDEDDDTDDEDDEGGVIAADNIDPLNILQECIENRIFCPTVEEFARYFNNLADQEKQRFHLFLEYLLDYVCTSVLRDLEEHNPLFTKHIYNVTKSECFDPNRKIDREILENAVLETIRNIAQAFFEYVSDDQINDE